MWHLHPDFKDHVTNSWGKVDRRSLDFSQKLSTLAKDLDQWNQTSFGNVIRETNTLKKRINGIQNHKSFQKSSFLQDLEKELVAQYTNRLNQVETFWAQRSRLLWLKMVIKTPSIFMLLLSGMRYPIRFTFSKMRAKLSP